MDCSAPRAPAGPDMLLDRASAPEPLPRVLIAFGGERAPVRALRDAFRFALALGAEPHVLRVVAPGSSAKLIPRHMAGRAQHEARRLIAAARHARVLCDRTLGERLPGPQVSALLGTFVEQVVLRAAEIQADLIAISPNRKQLVATVQCLARATNCAVLVPRRAGSFMRVLAATDLEEPSTPLLRRAAQLGRRLDASVVALHAVPADGSADAPSLVERLLMLEHATRRLGGRFESVVLRTGDPARDILEQSCHCNADIILVGTRRHAPGTAARVVRSAQRTVMVAPLTERGGSRCADGEPLVHAEWSGSAPRSSPRRPLAAPRSPA
jgi:nucleotide-binding universal stress UspA family protein